MITRCWGSNLSAQANAISDPPGEYLSLIHISQNYKLILKISIPVVIFIFVLIILIIKSEKNRKKAEELSVSLIEVLEMANQLNDEDTGDHVKRLGMYSTLLSEKANVPTDSRENICV